MNLTHAKMGGGNQHLSVEYLRQAISHGTS